VWKRIWKFESGGERRWGGWGVDGRKEGQFKNGEELRRSAWAQASCREEEEEEEEEVGRRWLLPACVMEAEEARGRVKVMCDV
jgi:hypothetical protein